MHFVCGTSAVGYVRIKKKVPGFCQIKDLYKRESVDMAGN